MSNEAMGYQFEIRVDLNEDVNLLALSDDVNTDFPLSKTDSITEVTVVEGTPLPSTRFGLHQFVVRGAIVSVFGTTGEVRWEGKGMGPTPVHIRFVRADLNRRLPT